MKIKHLPAYIVISALIILASGCGQDSAGQGEGNGNTGGSAINHAPTWQVSPTDIIITGNSVYNRKNGVAIDVDNGQSLVCSKTSANCGFAVYAGGSGANPQNCYIYFRAPIAAQTCNARIQAADNGAPSLTVGKTISITVRNNAPTWQTAPANITITSGSVYNQTNGVLTDPDSDQTLACSTSATSCIGFSPTYTGSGTSPLNCTLAFTTEQPETCDIRLVGTDNGTPALTIGTTINVAINAIPCIYGTNSDFSANNFNNWCDDSSGPGLANGVFSVTGGEARFNSLGGSNFFMKKFQTYTINTTADLEVNISYRWKQDSIAEDYGIAWVNVYLLDASSTVLGTITRGHSATTFYNCSGYNPATDNCQIEYGLSFAWSVDIIGLSTVIAGLSGINPANIAQIKIEFTSYNNAGTGTDAYWDYLNILPAGPCNYGTNSDFSTNNFNNWCDDSSGPGLVAGVFSVTVGKARFNSLAGSNYFMKKFQTYTINTTADLDVNISYRWKQDSIVSPYGIAWVDIYLLDASSTVLGTITRRHARTTFYDCTGFNPATDNCQIVYGSSFAWSVDTIDLATVIAGLSGISPANIAQIKIEFTSYNNAASGADAYWDYINISG